MKKARFMYLGHDKYFEDKLDEFMKAFDCKLVSSGLETQTGYRELNFEKQNK